MGGRSKSEEAKLPIVPMAHECHMALHAGDRDVMDRVLERAPAYWQSRGEWESARPYYSRFVSRREYLACVI